MDEFEQAQARLKPPGTTGWWDRVLPQLDDDRRSRLLQAADNRAISHRAISIVLADWGFEVRPNMVGHWRRNVR